MKDRILRYLHAFAEGRDENGLGPELRERLGLDEATFREQANEVRSSILHDYSHFSISTIDAFFQRVIRAFTREAGVLGDYRLEVDLDLVLNDVVGELIDELGDNPQLTRWVVDFARENLEQDKAWDIQNNLVGFSKEIFKEEFYAVEEEVLKRNSEPAHVLELQASLRKTRDSSLEYLRSRGLYVLGKLRELGAGVSDFKHGSSGSVFVLMGQYAALTGFEKIPGGKRESSDFLEASNWPSPKSRLSGAVHKLAKQELVGVLQELVTFKRDTLPLAIAADQVLANFYAYGLIADMVRKLADYKSENNLLLLADAPRFLNRIISDSDTPFIYEKVGSFYHNFLIDEFQDTSGLQWSNFRPLLINTLDEGHSSLVVGDVKQSIYRWRGGDLRLLQHKVEEHVGAHRVEILQLGQNYRSAREIVEFNNFFFPQAAANISINAGGSLPTDAYADVPQEVALGEMKGLVHIRFVDDKHAGDQENPLLMTCRILEDLQTKGIPLRGIAVLVRTNEEGRRTANFIIAHSASDKARSGCRYDVISNESLRLDGALSVKLLLACLRYLIRPGDDIARARLAFEYHELSGAKTHLHDVFDPTNSVSFEYALPPEFTQQKSSLLKLPLFELVETLVAIFRLNERSGELSYLLAFQDLVLQFFTRERNDIETFLTWWEEAEDEKRSIKVPDEVDAVRIMTIHKAKGLQFEHVIIPYCSWSQGHESFRPLLWVTSSESPFAEAGPVPVRFNSKLKESVFAEAYHEENIRAQLDNLNLLYVAFTRAIEGLHVISNGSQIGKLVRDTILATPQLMQHYSIRESTYKRGDVLKRTASADADTNKYLVEYPVNPWRNRLVIRKSFAGYFDGDSAAARDQQRYGIYLHTVLSRIRTVRDIPDALSAATATGAVPAEVLKSVSEQLEKLVSLPGVSDWFSPNADIRTEISILLPGGNEYRIDRLVIQGNMAVVIDYKTGTQQATDRKQVEAYIETLGRMGYRVVEGYLLYLREGLVVAVSKPQTKPLKSRRSGPDQLELEL